jgi:hypothetical protein
LSGGIGPSDPADRADLGLGVHKDAERGGRAPPQIRRQQYELADRRLADRRIDVEADLVGRSQTSSVPPLNGQQHQRRPAHVPARVAARPYVTTDDLDPTAARETGTRPCDLVRDAPNLPSGFRGSSAMKAPRQVLMKSVGLSSPFVPSRMSRHCGRFGAAADHGP